MPDYRTVAGTTRGTPSPDLLDTLYAMQRRQEWLREALVENDTAPLTFVASARLADEPEVVGREMRRTIATAACRSRAATTCSSTKRSIILAFCTRFLKFARI